LRSTKRQTTARQLEMPCVKVVEIPDGSAVTACAVDAIGLLVRCDGQQQRDDREEAGGQCSAKIGLRVDICLRLPPSTCVGSAASLDLLVSCHSVSASDGGLRRSSTIGTRARNISTMSDTPAGHRSSSCQPSEPQSRRGEACLLREEVDDEPVAFRAMTAL
jgi:hypothetical protein